MFLAGGPQTLQPSAGGILVFGGILAGVAVTIAGFVLLARGRRPAAALALGLGSLAGYFFPVLVFTAVLGVYLGVRNARRPAGGLDPLAMAGAGLGVVGALLSLALPAVFAYVLLFAITHGGRLPV